ncbi:MAG: AcrR family transcriptional regulator [Halieaceae bacterium]|jgi:AcrR family transcriptional regulator
MPRQKKPGKTPIPEKNAPKASESAKLKLTQEERTAISDGRMFKAAMKLVATKGAARTALKDICEEAGYSRGLATYRFGSKDAFFAALVAEFHTAWEKELKREVGSKRGLAAVLAATNTFKRFVLEHAGSMRGRYIIMFESLGVESEMRQCLRENFTIYVGDAERWVSEGIEDGTVDKSIDPRDFSILYNTFIFGTLYHWLLDAEQIDIVRHCDFWSLQVKNILAKKR